MCVSSYAKCVHQNHANDFALRVIFFPMSFSQGQKYYIYVYLGRGKVYINIKKPRQNFWITPPPLPPHSQFVK